MRALIALLIAAVIVPAVPGAYAADCPPMRNPSLAQPQLPLNIDHLKETLKNYHKNLYDSDIAAVDADAQAYIERRAGEAKKPALVLDIDETSLSNWRNLEANDFGFIPDGACKLLPKGPCGFTAWVRMHAAAPIAPTLALFNAAKRKGLAVFFITSRHQVDRQVTILNLNRAGYRGWTRLIMRAGDDTKRPVQAFKTEERKKISAQGYTIIVNVGDQQSDLDGDDTGDYAECKFKLPNPFYFIK